MNAYVVFKSKEDAVKSLKRYSFIKDNMLDKSRGLKSVLKLLIHASISNDAILFKKLVLGINSVY